MAAIVFVCMGSDLVDDAEDTAAAFVGQADRDAGVQRSSVDRIGLISAGVANRRATFGFINSEGDLLFHVVPFTREVNDGCSGRLTA